jgi:lysozyme family protein
MANINLLIPKILQWEGKFVNDPTDRGGATNMGVTFATFKEVFGEDSTIDELVSMTKEMFVMVLKNLYWDRRHADEIINQSVAEILVDWVWASEKWGIMIPQRILKTDDDGVVGPKTIASLNNQDQEDFFDKVKQARFSFINSIILHDPSQEKFHKGWNNRINDYVFKA